MPSTKGKETPSSAPKVKYPGVKDSRTTNSDKTVAKSGNKKKY